MGGGTGNKNNYKGEDAEDMCGSRLEPDPRYSGCCSNVFRPGRILRDVVVGFLVVLGVAVVVAVLFAVCFYLVPTQKDGESALSLEEGAFVGGPLEAETDHNAIEFGDETRYVVDEHRPRLEDIQEGDHHPDHHHHDHEDGHSNHHSEHHHIGPTPDAEPVPESEPETEPEAEAASELVSEVASEPASGHETGAAAPEPEATSEPEPHPESEPESEAEAEPSHDHSHPHDHDHTHDHTHPEAEPEPSHDHTHPQDTDHTHNHPHTHDHDHTHDHTHPQDADHTHDHAHSQDAGHTHDHPHTHDHDHPHTHDHDHTHDHTHPQDADHTHPQDADHTHPQDADHTHPQDADHTHDHPHIHDHEHTHPQDDGQMHDHPHAHDHDHTHPQEGDPTHGVPPHTHDHTHSQDADHTHDHPHTHDHDHTHPHTHDHDHTHPHDHDHTEDADHTHSHDATPTVRTDEPQLLQPQAPTPTPGHSDVSVTPNVAPDELPPVLHALSPRPNEEEVLTEVPLEAEEVPLGVCRPRKLEMCSVLPSSLTAFPNWAGDHSEASLFESSFPFLRDIVVGSRCSPRAQEYACAILEPPCTPEGTVLPPCRTFCRSVASTCKEFVLSRFSLSNVFDCDRFPDSSDPTVCLDLTQEVDQQVSPSTVPTEGPIATLSSAATHTDSETIHTVSQSPETAQTKFLPISETTQPDSILFDVTPTDTLPPEVTQSDQPAPPTTNPVSGQCPELQCLDGTCISFTQLHNGVNDCPSGTDEEDYEAALA